MQKELSYEQIDAQIRAINPEEYAVGGAQYFSATDVLANPGGVLQKICNIYRPIRGILVALSNFPLIPATWKAAIQTFINLLDNLCPA